MLICSYKAEAVSLCGELNNRCKEPRRELNSWRTFFSGSLIPGCRLSLMKRNHVVSLAQADHRPRVEHGIELSEWQAK